MFTKFVWNICVCVFAMVQNILDCRVVRIGISIKYEDVKLTGRLFVTVWYRSRSEGMCISSFTNLCSY
jgi:hypothetical protein